MTGDCAAADACSASGGVLPPYPYTPSVPANAFFLAAFATLVPASLILGYRFPALGFTVTFVTGLLLEILAFAGRLLLSGESDSSTFLALYLIGSVLGSTALAAAVLMVPPHVLGLYGGAWAAKGPHVAFAFLCLLVLTVGLEIVGVAYAVFGFDGAMSTRVLVAGLSVQLIALVAFVGIQVWLTTRLRRSSAQLDSEHAAIYRSARFKRFILVTQFSAAFLITVTIYRIAEVSPSLSTPAAQNEAAAIVVHGALPLVIAILLTAFHPGRAFGRLWPKTTPRYVSRKAALISTRSDNPYRAPDSRYIIRKVAPARLSPTARLSQTSAPVSPYELYPGPMSVRPSPTRSSHAASPGTSPRTVMAMKLSPTRSSHAVSPGHSPRKIPERRLVDDNALW